MQLYLGLDPTHFPKAIHYPVICTKWIEGEGLRKALLEYPKCTHSIFTSRPCVFYWGEAASFGKEEVIAIGKATAQELQLRGVSPLLAPVATQEGIIQLLETLNLENAYVFYPHSARARPCLTLYLQSRKIQVLSFDLYDTIFQKPEPVPSLETIDEIIFTSPSTVKGFLRIFKTIPQDKQLKCIGPITREALSKELSKFSFSGYTVEQFLIDT